jgi:hypothetical protein
MGISASFDLSRITNLETRLDVDEAVMVTNDDTTQQTIKNLAAPTFTATTANVTGLNNSLIQTTANANTQWMAGMEDPYTYYWALGKFHANIRDVELRAYMDNLVLRSGRKAGATAGGISLITNDALTAGINSDITITCNTGGQVRANTAFNGTAFNTTSARKFKEDIQTFTGSVLEKIKNTPVREYTLKSDGQKHIGLILDESPKELQADDEHLKIYDMVSFLWKAVQELTAELESVKGAAE